MKTSKSYDVIVVGAGHAGTEAALAAGRCGCQVLLLTMDKNAICRMSCNPAIGGLAKGHLVREVDALGGEMGLAIDKTGIQFRMLNKSKGPAVWALRAQADKKLYSLYMKAAVEREPNIDLREEEATEILVKNETVYGVRAAGGAEYFGTIVIITTGTFMRGLIHIGETNYPGGRRDEPPSIGLSDSLKAHGFEVVRFKTGTPARLHKDSINYSRCEEQPGDADPEPFSFRTEKLELQQASCWLTYTNAQTHEIIRKNLNRSPLYAGRIEGIGPRYCPSIEDKVVKFADKDRHQVYLEPEGWDSEEIYLNGVSTSLPKDVQSDFIRTIPGLENAKILRFGYAIEYDCLPPTQLSHSLETKKIKNLFLAGQVNCTSGYEEAAAQGMMAGLNAVRKLKGQAPFVLDRSQAYIGVLIDDLVTIGTNEPYRMFTSRAEFRLLLTQDNADERLMSYGYEFGLIDAGTYGAMKARQGFVDDLVSKLRSTWIQEGPLDKILRRPDESLITLQRHGLNTASITEKMRRRVEWLVKYEGYAHRQKLEVARFKKLEKRQIPAHVEYNKIKSLRREAKEKLERIKPSSVGQASRIPGITACDLSVVLVECERMSRR